MEETGNSLDVQIMELQWECQHSMCREETLFTDDEIVLASFWGYEA